MCEDREKNERALSEEAYMNVDMSMDHHRDVGLKSKKGNMTCLMFFLFQISVYPIV